ncbi:MAG: hypothetical protein IPO81_09385 [Kouleothrix sp.]|nr:hypothetical protein [Kouleothrix sp.]
MRLITATTWGTVYLLHFRAPLGNLGNPRAQASHYIGWADVLDERIAEHRAGRGARITRAAVHAGIDFDVVATWSAPLGFERVLKNKKNAPDFCPICATARRRLPKAIAVQLVLPLDGCGHEPYESMDDDDQVWAAIAATPLATSRVDWFEIAYYRQVRAARACVVPAPDFDAGLL